MPTLLRWKGYRFFFYSAAGWEPPHVHVGKDGKEARSGFTISALRSIWILARDLNEIVRKTREGKSSFLEAWNDYFGA